MDDEIPVSFGRSIGRDGTYRQEIGAGGESLLHELGFSLSRRTRRRSRGALIPIETNDSIVSIERCKAFEESGDPIISVDCEKKGLPGNFENDGRQWQAKGTNTTVNVYDHRSLSTGKALPYGAYDLVHDTGFVDVGIDHDSAEFAVESIGRWWKTIGGENSTRKLGIR